MQVLRAELAIHRARAQAVRGLLGLLEGRDLVRRYEATVALRSLFAEDEPEGAPGYHWYPSEAISLLSARGEERTVDSA